MSGPIRFVFAVIWFAIALQSCGALVDATKIMVGIAVEAHQHGGTKCGCSGGGGGCGEDC